MELVVFVLASAMVLGGALGVILRSHPVHCALSLVLTLFGIAVLFVAQNAHFLAVVQVIVYAGAIVVLFLFVIMLLGVDRVGGPPGRTVQGATTGRRRHRRRHHRPRRYGGADRRRRQQPRITGEKSLGGTLSGTEPNINELARSLFSTTSSPSRSPRSC